MRTTILLLLCLSQGIAGSFFTERERLIWIGTDMPNLDGATISPSGNCLAFHRGMSIDNTQYRGRVFFITPDRLEPLEIWTSRDTEATYFQCLDDKVLLQPDPKRFDVVYQFNLETGARSSYLEAGMSTNLGSIAEIRWFQVDDMDPEKHYFFGTVGGVEGLYRLNGSPQNIAMVVSNDTLMVDQYVVNLHISGSRLLSSAQLGDPIRNSIRRFMQTNLETGVSVFVESGESQGRSVEGHFFRAQLRAFGNLYFIQTARNPFALFEKDMGFQTHVFRVGRGNSVPNDPFEDNGPEVVVSHPWMSNYVTYSFSATWGKTGFVLYTESAPFGRPIAMLEDGNVLMSYGDRLPGGYTAEDFGRPTSNRQGLVLPIRSFERDGTPTSGLYFFRMEPDIPVEENVLPAFTSENVVNAASYEAGPIAPDEWVSILGENLAPEEGAARVFLDGVEIIPIYSSSTQINILTPMALPETSLLSVVHYDTEGVEITRHEVSLETAQYAPGLFQYGGQPIISDNRTFGLSDEARPLPQGGVFNLWGTGFGDKAPISVTVGDRNIDVLWVGRVMDGLMQVNILLPADITGDVSGEVRIAGKSFPFNVCVENH